MTATNVAKLVKEDPSVPVFTGPKVYGAIASVMAELGREGIAKERRNTQGSGYNFRGIDDIYNTLSALLAKNHLCIVPRVLSRECVERSSKAGGALFYTTVDVEFDLICAVDGSSHTARTVGEAMDSGDKSSNKAMSAAYKYMAFQTFCIPTEGDNDADASTPQVLAAELAASQMLRGCADRPALAALWEKNRPGWKEMLAPEAYARVVAVMKAVAAQLPEIKPEPAADDFGIGPDEIPF